MLGLKRDIGQKERLTTEVKSIQADFPRTWTSNDQYHTNSTRKKYLTTAMIESAFCIIISGSTFSGFYVQIWFSNKVLCTVQILTNSIRACCSLEVLLLCRVIFNGKCQFIHHSGSNLVAKQFNKKKKKTSNFSQGGTIVSLSNLVKENAPTVSCFQT